MEKIYIVLQKKYNTTVQQLIDLNKLHNTVLSVGQNIVISEKDIKEEKNSFDYQQFLKQNLGTGTLKVQTLIGTTYFPIPSVKIEIYKDFFVVGGFLWKILKNYWKCILMMKK